jgi:hypothetical protein
VETHATRTCNNQNHKKTRKSFNTMEAFNLLIAVVVAVLILQGACAVVLAIWMIVLLIPHPRRGGQDG